MNEEGTVRDAAPRRAGVGRCVALMTVVLAIGAGTVAAAQNFDQVEIKSAKVGEGVYMLTGAGGNIGLFTGADGTVMIDDQFAPLSPRIKAAIQAITDKPVRIIINTHWHGDHTGGNVNFVGDGAEVFAHENVRKRMSETQINRAFNDTTPPSPAKALPVVTFEDGVSLHLNGDDVRVVHVPPAHTDGDSYVWFQRANVIHAGDLCFNGFYPFIDASSGGSIDGMIHADDLLLALANNQTKIIPGHGPLTDKAGLKRFRDMLADLRDRVARQILAGRTKDQMIAAHVTADLDSTWGRGFMKPAVFLGSVYDDLSSRRNDTTGRKGAKK